MRRRRVERCLIRAKLALEAGFPEDATAALEEARRLDPYAPELAELERQVPALPVTVVAPRFVDVVAQPLAATTEAAPPDTSRRRYVLAAAMVIAIAGGALLATWARGTVPGQTLAVASPAVVPTNAAAPPPAPAPQQPTPVDTKASVPEPQPSAEPPSAPPAADLPVAAVSDLPPVREAPAPANGPITISRQQAVAVETRDVKPTPPAPRPDPPVQDQKPAFAPPASLPSIGRIAETTLPGTTTTPPPPPPTPVPDPLPAVDAAPRPVPTTGTDRAAETERRTEPAPPPPPPDRPDSRVQIRGVLSKYEAAFSALDAAAAHAVWPGVDQGTLARAFGSLESQRVSLGRCDITVGTAVAQARCSGSATWKPKVGGGGRTESRQWTFELVNAGDQWQIVRAQTR